MQIAQQDALDLKTDLLPNYIFTRVTYLSVLVEDTYSYIDTQAHTVGIGTPNNQGMDSGGFINLNFP
jgi:hypothetical protein